MNWNKALGAMGERFAAEVLQKQGLTVLERGWRSPYGEIDIIARDTEYICFIEVKTRRENSSFPGEQAVNSTKQRRIIQTALCYLAQTDCQLQPRFDMLSIITNKQGHILHYNYWTGAFDDGAYSKHF